MSKDWENKVTTIDETKDLNSMSIESLINSLTSYELKLKSNVQGKKEAIAKKSIALKVEQEEEDLYPLMIMMKR